LPSFGLAHQRYIQTKALYRSCLVTPKSKNFLRSPIILNLAAHVWNIKALFSSEKILAFSIVAFSFLFDKYYPIMDKLSSKDSSRDLQVNCAISFLFSFISNASCMCPKIRCDGEF